MKRMASPGCKALIKHFEASAGAHLKAYICPSGLPTIGWGTVLEPGETLDLVITLEEADRRFEKALVIRENRVNDLFANVELTQNQFDALVSFAYNLKPSLFTPKNCTLIRLIQSRKYQEAGAQFLRWCHGEKIDPKTKRKQVLPGLARRRKCEKFIYETGNYAKLVKCSYFQFEAN